MLSLPCYTATDAEKRQTVAFVGGLDLTIGRYDDQQHHLFQTLRTQHAGDFRNKCFKVSSTQGPRQPWHDIHSKVRGQAAVDVLTNLRERWARQGDNKAEGPMDVSAHEWHAVPNLGGSKESWKVQVRVVKL